MNLIEAQKFIFNKVKYGFVDSKLNRYYPPFENLDKEKLYHLQSKEELMQTKCGWCWDCVEFYRDFCRENHIEFHAYFLEYEDEILHQTHTAAVAKLKAGYVLLIDNSFPKFKLQEPHKDLNELTKKIYKDFQDYIKTIVKNPDPIKYYFNQYSKPRSDDFINEVKNPKFYGKIRNEYSSMSIVLCKNKILCLKDKENKIVLPKGHIEKNEKPLDTAIRECKEESGVIITKGDFVSEVDGFEYTFSGANLKFMTNSKFYEVFKTNAIHKRIKAFYFEIPNERMINITEEENFTEGIYLDINEFLTNVAYDNTRQVVLRALELRNNKK